MVLNKIFLNSGMVRQSEKHHLQIYNFSLQKHSLLNYYKLYVAYKKRLGDSLSKKQNNKKSETFETKSTRTSHQYTQSYIINYFHDLSSVSIL